MTTVAEQLRQYIVAMSDPTRGAILMELGHAGELTPTQIARRLGLTANNVYHHMRVLRDLGVVDPPRAVPHETYVEKYYRINSDMAAAINSDPEWVDKTQVTMTPADRKALYVGMCMTMAQLLMRAAKRYEAMDDESFDQLVFQQQLGMASINSRDRKWLARRLASLRAVLREEWEADAAAESEGAGDATPPQHDMVLMAGLPLIWDDEEGDANG